MIRPLTVLRKMPTSVATGIWWEPTNAWQQGFVTPYAMSESREDFVENIAVYVTNTKDYWNNMLQNAGENGRTLIKQKFEIVYSYMEQTWESIWTNYAIVLRRQDDIANGNVDLSIIE